MRGFFLLEMFWLDTYKFCVLLVPIVLLNYTYLSRSSFYLHKTSTSCLFYQ
jgi:hypothetical protein